jgi:cbb3-type cytochrome oxidase cytochrome c subunit
MRSSMMALRSLAGALCLAAAAALLPLMAAAGPNPQNAVRIFKKHGCIGCHNQKDGPGSGPDLTHVGQRMDFAAIRKQIVNPKARKRDSLMPSARDLGLKRAEVDVLAAYLVSLK